ncbi:hypothetical protein LTR66_005920 [Elasticomyces elasticus]|nr:hypothetical protein LTR28_013208 [Elasticomyces elasticus]KAK4993754.1 hypothetical protein LTR66_005920 [Elasticomyces elasticus]
MAEPAYLTIAVRKQEERQSRIPREWLLPSYSKPAPNRSNILEIPRACGLLSDEEVKLTDEYDAVALLEQLRSRTITSVDVARAFCKTNCLTEIFFEDALARAKELDLHIEKTGRPIGPLHGLPISLKDSFRVKGYDASIGLTPLCFQPASRNSALVDLLLAAGAVLYCKTNIPQTLMALDSHNHVFGRTLNPANLQLTAGGSSGGEGALLAMRGSVLGVGTDVGGSIRIPAMCNGLVGIKPSHGRVPYSGQTHPAAEGAAKMGVESSAGPMGRSVRDCEMFLRVVGDMEPWLWDPECVAQNWTQQSPLVTSLGQAGSEVLRIGIVRTDGVTTPLPPNQTLLDELAAMLGSAAAFEIVEMDITPLFSQCQSLANGLFSIDGGNHILDLLDSTGEPLSPWLQTRLKRRPKMSLDKVQELHARRTELQAKFLRIWDEDGGYWKGRPGREQDRRGQKKRLDAFICPVAPHPVPPIDRYNTVSYTSSFVLLDYPAGTLPVRPLRVDDLKEELTEAKPLSSWDKTNRDLWTKVDKSVYLGSPLCVQVVCPRLMERKLCGVMAALENAFKKLSKNEMVAKL